MPRSNRTVLFPLLAALGFVAGCTTDSGRDDPPVAHSLFASTPSDPGPETAPPNSSAESPRPYIQSAAYKGRFGDATRTVVQISGSHFKPNPSVADCMTRIPGSGNPAYFKWKNATRIISANTLDYQVVVQDSAGNDAVEIAVRGSDGRWSNIFTILK